MTKPSQRPEIINAALDARLQELRKTSETSFLSGEHTRILQGGERLQTLLALRNKEINHILGIDRLPKDADIMKDLLTPSRIYPFETTVELNGRTFRVAGVRIQNNLVDPQGKGKEAGFIFPTGGGSRATLVKKAEGSLLTEHVMDQGAGLAAAMSPKNWALNIGGHLVSALKNIGHPEKIPAAANMILGGGAKLDIVIEVDDPNAISPSEKKELIAKALEVSGYELAKAGVLDPRSDRAAGDRNTTSSISGRPVIEWLLDGFMRAAREKGEAITNFMRAVVTGKSLNNGGLEARDDATGIGGWEAFTAFMDKKAYPKEKYKDLNVFFRGCGSAARASIIGAAESGMKVQAISFFGGIITSENGFTPADAKVLFDMDVNGNGNILDWASRPEQQERGIRVAAVNEAKTGEGIEKITRDFLEKEKFSVYFEAATERTVNKELAPNIPNNAIIVELGNGVTTPEGAEILDAKNVSRLTGAMANAGGVFASWFEAAQDLHNVSFTTPVVNNEIRGLMRQNVGNAVDLQNLAKARGVDVSLEQAFYAIAIAKGYAGKAEAEKLLSKAG